MVSNWKTQLVAKDGKLYLVTFHFPCGLSSLLWCISSHCGKSSRESGLKFHVISPNWSFCTNCRGLTSSPAVDLLEKAGTGSVQYQTAPSSPLRSQTLVTYTLQVTHSVFLPVNYPKQLKLLIYDWLLEVSGEMDTGFVFHTVIPTVKKGFKQEFSNWIVFRISY